MGLGQMFGGAKRANNLKKQIQDYKTPKELEQIYNATQSMASSGFDPATLEYMTGQTNKQSAAALGTAARMGADPNALGAILDQNLDRLVQIGSENARMNMQRFGQFMEASQMLASSRDAERVSKNNRIKDELQQAATDKAQGFANFGNALNTLVSVDANNKIGKLFTDQGGNTTGASTMPTPRSTEPIQPVGLPKPAAPDFSRFTPPNNSTYSRFLAAYQSFTPMVPNSPMQQPQQPTETYADYMRRTMGIR